MKTELEIAYGRSKVRYQDTKEFISRLKDATSRIGPARYALDIKKEIETLIIDFERKIQP